MNQTELNELIDQVQRAAKRWYLLRWIQAIGGVALVLYSFSLIFFSASMPIWLRSENRIFFSFFGGSMFGAALSNWHGGKELVMLLKFKAHFEAEEQHPL